MGNESSYEKFLNWCEDKWTREYKMKRILSRLYNDDLDFLKEQLTTNVLAILEELLEEFEKLDPNPERSTYYAAIDDCSSLIQQTINELKRESEENG